MREEKSVFVIYEDASPRGPRLTVLVLPCLLQGCAILVSHISTPPSPFPLEKNCNDKCSQPFVFVEGWGRVFYNGKMEKIGCLIPIHIVTRVFAVFL